MGISTSPEAALAVTHATTRLSARRSGIYTFWDYFRNAYALHRFGRTDTSRPEQVPSPGRWIRSDRKCGSSSPDDCAS